MLQALGSLEGRDGTPPLGPDGPEHTPSVRDGAQASDPHDPSILEAWDFDDAQAGAQCANVHHGLDLEAVAIEVENREHPAPERVVAVAQVGVATAVQPADHADERLVPPPSVERHVAGSGTVQEP